MSCLCEIGAALPDVPNISTPERVGQIQKLIFMRRLDGSARNGFTIATADPALLATWTAAFAAADNTKTVITPFIQGPEVTPGEPETFGGGNDTVDGIEIVTGKTATLMQAMFHNIDQRVIEALDKMGCEDIGVFLVNECGQIIGVTDDKDTPTVFRPIPIPLNSYFIGDKAIGGKVSPDMNMIRFQLYPDWSKKLYFVNPTDFEAREDLINA